VLSRIITAVMMAGLLAGCSGGSESGHGRTIAQYTIQANNNNDPQDIISVPDGSIWFTGLAEIGKISPDGTMEVWHEISIGSAVGLPDALAVGREGEVWYTDEVAISVT
jgi:streptogramin lyase